MMNNSLLQEILDGLGRDQKSLPSKLFYDENGSKLFEKICELEEYYPTKTEIKIMEDNINDIASLFNDDTLFIEFGSGSSYKTKYLLEHINGLAGYIPIDISKEYLLQSVEKLNKEFPQFDVYPLPEDYTQPLELPLIKKSVKKKIAYYPGSTIGNFTYNDAKNFLKIIADLIGKDGGLIIGVDLKKELQILEKAYNDSKGITAKFNLNILKRLNNEFNFNIDINNFEHRAIYNEEFGRIEMHLVSLRDQVFYNSSNMFSMKEGETILTEYSHKYSLKDFEKLVSDYFNVEKVWIDKNNFFSVQYLTRKK